MNTKTVKAVTLAASLIAGMGATSPAMATLTTGGIAAPQTLGVQFAGQPPRIDVWTFSCPAAFPWGRARVQDSTLINSPTNRLWVTLGRNGLTNEVRDNNTGLGFLLGEGGGFSVPAVVNGGPGLYVAAFKKTLVGAERYTGDLYCVNAANVRINPVITLMINQ